MATEASKAEFDGDGCVACGDVIDSRIPALSPYWSDWWDNIVCRDCADEVSLVDSKF